MQAIHHFCPSVRGVGLLSAGLVSGSPGVHVAQTLRFSKFLGLLPAPFAFGAFWAQYRTLDRVRRISTLQTAVLIDWIGPWRTRPQRSALLLNFLRAYFGID